MAVTKYKTINPLQFILGQVLKNNLILVRFKNGVMPEDAPVKDCMEYFNRTIPAGTSYLLFTQTEANLIECPSSNFGTQDMVAFHVYEDTEVDSEPVDSERIIATDRLF